LVGQWEGNFTGAEGEARMNCGGQEECKFGKL